MLIIDGIMRSLKEYIAQNISDSLTSVKLSYEKNIVPNPIRRTHIVLNPSDVKVTPYHDEYSTFLKKTEYKVKIEIHRPEMSDPERLLSIFSEIVTILDESHIFNIEESGCSEIRSGSDTNSIYLPAYVKFAVIS